MGGGSRPFSTIVFKKVTKQNKENLSDTKIFYVTKGCLKNLARAKSALRARNLKKSIFGATDFDPPPSTLPHHHRVKPNLQMSSKQFEMCSKFFNNPTHVVTTTNMCLSSLAEILPQKFLTNLSNSLNFGCYDGENCTKCLKVKVGTKCFQMSCIRVLCDKNLALQRSSK